MCYVMLIADSHSLMEEIFVAIVKDGKMSTMRSHFLQSQAIKKAVWTKKHRHNMIWTCRHGKFKKKEETSRHGYSKLYKYTFIL